jgi:hypothetical protein
MKLGKARPRLSAKTLWISKYFTDALPPAPESVDWGKNVDPWGMMRNDEVGDCTCATAGHLIMDWTTAEGARYVPPDSDILAAYSDITGYDPATGLNDNGAAELDVLNYWRKTGVSGRKISAFAMVNTRNREHVKASVWMFGGLYIGLALPISAQHQDVWDVVPGEDGEVGSWGGHAVPIVGYDADGLTCVTWGSAKRMTWEFFLAYCDEAYAVLSGDWTGIDAKAPNGFDVSQLQKDLKAVAA